MSLLKAASELVDPTTRSPSQSQRKTWNPHWGSGFANKRRRAQCTGTESNEKDSVWDSQTLKKKQHKNPHNEPMNGLVCLPLPHLYLSLSPFCLKQFPYYLFNFSVQCASKSRLIPLITKISCIPVWSSPSDITSAWRNSAKHRQCPLCPLP